MLFTVFGSLGFAFGKQDPSHGPVETIFDLTKCCGCERLSISRRAHRVRMPCFFGGKSSGIDAALCHVDEHKKVRDSSDELCRSRIGWRSQLGWFEEHYILRLGKRRLVVNKLSAIDDGFAFLPVVGIGTAGFFCGLRNLFRSSLVDTSNERAYAVADIAIQR